MRTSRRGEHVVAGTPAAGGWTGSVVAGPGLLEFSGRVGSTIAHAHAAVQVLQVFRGAVLMRDAAGVQRPVRSCVIPTGVRHVMLASPGARGRVRYVDPISPTGRLAMRRVRETGLDVERLDAWLIDMDVATLDAAIPPATDVHPAIAEALRLGPTLTGGPMLLSDLADRVGLSTSRLGHLFAEQVGVPYPVWRRWLRLQQALATVQRGASLTTAAHASGFADSAHLTSSCRAMFGITPTEAVRAAGVGAVG
jgi:AraC-like DNA-binding protein